MRNRSCRFRIARSLCCTLLCGLFGGTFVIKGGKSPRTETYESISSHHIASLWQRLQQEGYVSVQISPSISKREAKYVHAVCMRCKYDGALTLYDYTNAGIIQHMKRVHAQKCMCSCMGCGRYFLDIFSFYGHHCSFNQLPADQRSNGRLMPITVGFLAIVRQTELLLLDCAVSIPGLFQLPRKRVFSKGRPAVSLQKRQRAVPQRVYTAPTIQTIMLPAHVPAGLRDLPSGVLHPKFLSHSMCPVRCDQEPAFACTIRLDSVSYIL